MTASEAVKVLSSEDKLAKVSLFNFLSEKVLEGGTLEDWEVSVFEALKKQVIQTNGIVFMSATMTGIGGLS